MTAKSARRKGDEGSWIATLGGAVLLVGLGFLGGIVAGVLTEEPGLVWAHLRGESVETRLPEVAAPLPQEVEAPRPETEAKAKPSTPDSARTSFAVQVGAFKKLSQAEALEAKLLAEGHTVYISSRKGSHRVRVGPVADRSEAEGVAKTLAERDLPTWILSE